MMDAKGQLILAVSGVSGSGKSSILKYLKEQHDLFVYVVSCTTRPKRAGETEGVDYHYLSAEEFDKGVRDGQFLEWEEIHGCKYGRKKKDFLEAFESGKVPILEIDVLGLKKIKKIFKNIVPVFIIAPSKDEAIKRLSKRNREDAAEQQKRIDRYEFELAERKNFKYTIINDDLKRAQSEMMQIVTKEKSGFEHKHKFNSVVKNSLLLLFVTLFFGASIAQALYLKSYNRSKAEQKTAAITVADTIKEEEPPASTPIPTPTETKKKIAANPPKYETPQKQSVVEDTTTNDDGSETTTVSTGGGISASDLSRTAESSSSPNSPLEVIVRDETGLYADLPNLLKNYLNTLKWRTEISFLREITIRDAGAIGWTGQYLGRYTTLPSGKITDAYGSIILNTYYDKDSPEFNSYMELVLSHEYGHHYTQYHKWIDLNLPIGERFPDLYYTTRPLSKSDTALDYSLGWANSETEIIAEDYSYIYSGFGSHAMSTEHGLPASSLKSWLDNLGSTTLVENQTNTAPTVSIIAPAAGALSGMVSFKAQTSDDILVQKVSFYAGDTLISEDATAPYEVLLDTGKYANGSKTLKVIATDGSLTSEATVTVDISNTITVSVVTPATDPYAWVSGNLAIQIKVEATDMIKKIELFVNNQSSNVWNYNPADPAKSVTVNYSLAGADPGTYTFTFLATDEGGNTFEKLLTVNKSS